MQYDKGDYASFRLPATSNAQDWEASFDCFDDDMGEAANLADMSASMEVRSTTGQAVLTGSTADGIMTITGNALSWFIPEATMRAIQPGLYTVYGRLTANTGEVSQAFICKLQIIEGGFK